MTKMRAGVKGEGIVFSVPLNEVVTAFQFDEVALHAQIKVAFEQMTQ